MTSKLVCFKIVFLICWINLAQEKKNLTPEDYKLWHTLNMGTSSYDGNWVSYKKSYKNSKDTLYLTNTKTKNLYVLPNGYNEHLTPNGDWFGYMETNTLKLLETKTGRNLSYINVIQYDFSKDGMYLMYIQKTPISSLMKVKNLETGYEHSFENIVNYSINPLGINIAILQSNDKNRIIKLLRLANLKDPETLSIYQDFEVEQLTWNKTGSAFGYALTDKESKINKIILHNDIEERPTAYTLASTSVESFLKSRHIAKTKLFISDHGDKVFFDTAKTEKLDIDNDVKIWKSTDKQFPNRKIANYHQWNVWEPKLNTIQRIENDSLVVCGLANNLDKAVLLDNNRYLPLYKFGDRFSDVYIMDLDSGFKTKILEKQLRIHNHLITSPNSKHIAYFKDKNWWSYNIETGLHKCLTKNLNSKFNKSKSDRLDTHRAHGFAGWTTNGEIMVYDEFDIWLLSIEGNYSAKLTNGSNDQIKHRIYTYASKLIRDSFFGYGSDYQDIKSGILISTMDNKTYNEGFGLWSVEEGFKSLISKKRKLGYIKRTEDLKSFLFTESSFDVSPKLMLLNKKNEQFTIAFSNIQQDSFYWGKSELIHYFGTNGTELKAALFYPANYDLNKKYPLIVSIYEKKSDALHQYTLPSITNYGGLNTTNYTSEGYFVLMPDISYELNNPGKSALNSVLSSVDKAKESVSIDENKIGLIGHSFGGFETTYIISQTNRFKTAVAGAGVTDLLSFYLDIDSSNLSNMERFESEQFRNQIPFTNSEFNNESPIMNVKTMKTPLMLFIGDKDQMVAPSYNIKLFAALWRLKKDIVLLIYPNEGHTILNEDHLKDLTIKTKNWFDYHLKESLEPKWLKK